MLTQRYSPEMLAGVLQPREAWRPFPACEERAAWEGLPADARTQLLERGERALMDDWPALPATLFLEFARNGNRSRYQDAHFARRHLLCDLVLAECAEGDGRFLDEIANGVWALCEESYWGVPAHISVQRAGVGLPDTTEPTVDLFAAETAVLLAWTAYLLGPALDGVSPLIRPRIVRETDDRLLTPCLERDDFWWMGLQGNRWVNNWNPWIVSNWLACALLLEGDPARRLAAVAKGMRCLDVFIDSYPEDGGCDEGPSYWGRAGASMFDCLELLHSATGGAVDVFGEEKVKNIGRYAYRAHIADRWVVNFADAPARTGSSPALVFRYGNAIGDEAMMAFGAAMAELAGPGRHGRESLARALPALFALRDLQAAPADPPLPRDVWLPDTQFMVARQHGGRTDGLFLAAKGGHNAESHNHNDVGHFIVYTDGRPTLIDVGVETYSRKTFSAERYDIWTMQSPYHNLPTVNGVMQRDGREYAARDLEYAADDRTARFALDIAGAYPPEAGILAWRRAFAFDRAGEVTVTDTYRLETATSLVFSLITPCVVTINPAGVITLAERPLAEGLVSGRAVVRFPADRLAAECEEIAVADPQLQATWGDRLFRILLHVIAPATDGEVSVRIATG